MNVRSKLFYVYISIVALYALSFLLPRSIATIRAYELSSMQYFLLSLTVLIPICLIWYAAFNGYSMLRDYTHTIRNTPDGKHVAKLTTGILLLAIGLPVSSLSGSVVSILTEHYGHAVAAATIIRNYVLLVFPMAGFIYISLGAHGLSLLAKQRPSYRAINVLGAIFVAIAIVYSFVILESQNLQTLYHMPAWLVLSTLVAPYLFMWHVGLFSAYEIYLYSSKAPGLLYRKTWRLLAAGIGAIIIMQIATQYVTLLTVQFTHLRLLRLLIIVYIFLASLSVGYVMVAMGAKRLKKIEEV